MGRYLRKSKGLREVVDMEDSAETTIPPPPPPLEVVVMEKSDETTIPLPPAERKRKIGKGEQDPAAESTVQLKTRRLSTAVKQGNSASPARSGDSTCESAGSDRDFASCCSSNGHGEGEVAAGGSKSVDLEEEASSVELLAASVGESVEFRDRRETTPSSGLQLEIGEMESTARPPELNNPRRPIPSTMPSEAELEEFFSAAEKDLQKQFIEKYNFDIVKDEPLDGRYEWVEIRP